MSSFQARIWTQQQLAYCPLTSVHGEAWQIVRAYTTSGAGAADGTTVVAANFGGSNDDYNGRWWIEILSGSCEGQWKRVVDYVSASGTFTVENNGFTAQIASSVQFRLWKSPEPVVVIDSSSGETNAVDAVRADGNDFWNGYYLVPITGTHRGKVAQITDFVSGSGTFTLAAGFGSALAAGDVCLLRRFVESGDVSLSLSEDYVPRPGNRVNFSMGDGIRGPRGGTCSFALQIRPTNSAAGDATQIGKSESAGLLEACGLQETLTTGSTVTAGGSLSTTAVDSAGGTWETWAIGAMIVVNGEATFITDMTDNTTYDTLTVSPPLSATPTVGDIIYATAMYSKTTDGDQYGCVLEYEIDGVRTTMTGCKGNVTLRDGATPEFAFEFNIDHWTREIEAAPYNAVSAYSTAPPVLSQERIAYLGTTKTDISGFTATPGTKTSARTVQGAVGANGRSSYQITGYEAGGTWQELLDNTVELSQEVRWLTRASNALAVIYGSHAQTFACRIPAARHRESPHPSDADGLASVPNVFDAQDAGVQTYGVSNGTTAKVPDFAFHIS